MTDTQRAALRAHLDDRDSLALADIYMSNSHHDKNPLTHCTVSEFADHIMTFPDDVLESIMKAEGL